MADYLCIYHGGGCPDGFGSAWVVRRWFEATHEAGDRIEFHAATYDQPPPDVVGKRVYLVDFSYSAETVHDLALKAEFVAVLDHHKTAQEALQPLRDVGRIRGQFEPKLSGVGVCWDYFFQGEPMPRLLQYVQDRDLWKWELPYTREITGWLASFPQQFDVWDALIEELETVGDTSAIVQGRAIVRQREQDIQRALPVVTRRLTVGGVEVPVACLPAAWASEAGHILAQGEPFAAIYYDGPEQRHFSLRSAEDGLDVSEVAKAYGGGGHRRAAGFSVPRAHELARA
jgi:hypothetical protein